MYCEKQLRKFIISDHVRHQSLRRIRATEEKCSIEDHAEYHLLKLLVHDEDPQVIVTDLPCHIPFGNSRLEYPDSELQRVSRARSNFAIIR
jgi:hypothetical protein